MIEGQFYPRQGLQFIDSFRPAVVASGLSVSYITSVSDTTNVAAPSTYTFNGVSIGAAHAQRLIVIGLEGATTPTPATWSMTVNGNAATELVTASGSQTVSIFAKYVPTGTTADFVVTVGANTTTNITLSIWRVIGKTTETAYRTATDTANDFALALDTVDNGVVIIAARNAVPTATISWSGATEDFDAANGAEGRFAGASATTVAATGAVYSGTWTDTTGGEAAAAVSLSP